MSRFITVKGVGKYSSKPDVIILTLSLTAQKMKYEDSMGLAQTQITQLREAFLPLGFEKEDLKTANFSVNTCYESYRDKNDNYCKRFTGYSVSHSLKLEFALDSKLLAKVLGAVADSMSKPEIRIKFAIKDRDAVCAALLEDAAKNAREKAEILTRASGVKLGKLASIDYNWGEISLLSRTEYELPNRCMECSSDAGIDIEPDDVDVRDTVTLVWEIED